MTENNSVKASLKADARVLDLYRNNLLSIDWKSLKITIFQKRGEKVEEELRFWKTRNGRLVTKVDEFPITKARLLWLLANGEVGTSGACVIHVNGDWTDCSLGNLGLTELQNMPLVSKLRKSGAKVPKGMYVHSKRPDLNIVKRFCSYLSNLF